MNGRLQTPYTLEGKRIFVAGHAGMVGSAVCRRLAGMDCQILTIERADLDLRRQTAVEEWFAEARPQAVIMAAATVGGIEANDTRPAEFLHDNLMIEANVIEAARTSAVEKLLFLSSACTYPRDAAQPMKEEALLGGPLEPTNQWYAVAKIAGIKLCQAYRRQYGLDFISVQPANLYGPGDNFDPRSSHVVPALMVRAHLAKIEGLDELEIWGTGEPLREFLHVDDLARALIHLLGVYSDESPINIGPGKATSIRQLAEGVASAVGFPGRLVFDTSKPDGMPRKLLDATRMTDLGWTASTELEAGLGQTYEWYLENLA